MQICFIIKCFIYHVYCVALYITCITIISMNVCDIFIHIYDCNEMNSDQNIKTSDIQCTYMYIFFAQN